MKPNLLKILTFSLLFIYLPGVAQEIFRESFSTPNKGVWGADDGTSIQSDFSEIDTWMLDYSKIQLAGANDYAKTVTTAGGRFECCDINGEVIWKLTTLNISAYKNISITMQAKETGNGNNAETKYLKAYYVLNNDEPTLFETKAQNSGNWGSSIISQTGLNGDSLKILIHIDNHYSSDKVILDEVVVNGEEQNPVAINPGDVLINEVLFNPVPDGEDFVEVYNVSNKQIPLNKLYLASRNKNLELEQIYPLSSKKINFEPESYLALTKDTNGIFPWFIIECPACFLQMTKIPSFNNDNDYVVLLNADMEIIDEFFYDEKMHAPLLHDREGITLERISFSMATNSNSNWHSASTASGYGTPGYRNSQFENAGLQKAAVTFQPDAFSPNNDGYNDMYSINFELDKPGYLTNIWIYDSAGRMIRKLANNSILGTTDEITWNGEDETGQRQKLGVYVVLVEIFNTEGFVKQFKDGVVLTDILE